MLSTYASYYLQRVQARLGGQVAAAPVEFQRVAVTPI
jgi:hypothetical protein